MEQFIIYMAKASGLLGVFFLAYYLLLRKETFFNSNRKFLIAGLLTSLLLPLAFYTKTIWVDPVPQHDVENINIDELLMMHHQVTAAAKELPAPINWFDVAAGLYLAGALFFLIRFIIDALSIKRMLKGQTIHQQGSFLMVDSPKVPSPFSFFNYIFYNSAILQPQELESIICHEKVHSAQRHSLDMVITQLFCVAFWFNPFAWFYKKAVAQNLEFIADAVATKQIADKQAYQKTLLKITIQPDCIAITNHFYQSLIKKRIVMLNKQQSRKRNAVKYAVVLPVLAAFMLLFQVKVVAQEKQPAHFTSQTKIKVALEVTKDSKDTELNAEKESFKKEFDTDVNFQNITRNNKNEITGIKVTVKDKSQSKVYEVAGADPISPFTIEVEKGSNTDKNNISFGTPRKLRDITTKVFRYNADADTDSLYSGPPTIVKGYGSIGQVPPPPAAPGHPGLINLQGNGNVFVQVPSINTNDMLVVINGVKQPAGAAVQLPIGQEIDKVNILNDKDGKKKYGKEGKKGVVEITSRRSQSAHFIHSEPKGYILKTDEMGDMDINMDIDMGSLNELRKLIKLSELKGLENFNFEFTGELSTEEIKRIKEELKEAQVEIENAMPEIEESMRMLSSPEYKKEMADARREIANAKKEIKAAMKEIMEARREAVKEAKEEAKKEYKKSEAKKSNQKG